MISVIIPAYNSAATLPACLKALANQTLPPDEVIVVDDSSKDNTVEIARQAGVRVLIQPHAGPAAARNLGVQQAKGELVFFTDSDCEPVTDWVEQLSLPFKHPQVVGAKGTYRCRQVGQVPRFVQQEYESKYARLARQESIDFIDTNSAAYRREVFLKNGGFDPVFPVPSVEDAEFSFRLARKGYRLVFAPLACVYHLHDHDLGDYVRRKYGIGYWKAFMMRWLPEKTLSDSHSLPSQRWQILFLGLTSVLALLVFFWLPAVWLALTSLLFFFGTALPFLTQIRKKDRSIIATAIGLIVCRAAALGLGLAVGFIFPPRSHHRPEAGLMLWERLLKRMMDIMGGLVGLIFSLPVLLVAGIAIKLDSPGPILFMQERCGENGKTFWVCKLRTMTAGAEQQEQDVMTQLQPEGYVVKIPNDPRMTRVGRLLRRWSVDELPQFWNVLRGEMSLIGPRPEQTWMVAQYDDRHRQRLLIKPGISGPMQVNGRGDLDMEARLALELDYIQHYSLWKDIVILLRTIPAVISGKGAY